VLPFQGEDDEYATMVQIDGIAAQAGDAELFKLADCRHAPHKDQPQAVIDVMAEFADRVAGD
jgi:pimeloyl-ACP methyl ester carboxylesterase